MTMPFSPCSNAAAGSTQCDDKSVQMLNHIFGDVINKLALDGDIEGVNETSNILASMFSVFNSSVLVIGSIIITYIAIIGVIHTANDGVALGRKWSSLWVPVRLVFSALMLLPTTSGYSMIQLFVFMIALWGAGAANSTYKSGIETGLFNPEALVKDIGNKKDTYNLMPLATAYLENAYCAKLVNNHYSGAQVRILDLNTPDLTIPATNGEKRKTNTYQFKDRNNSTNIAGGAAVCGTISISEFVSPGSVGNMTDAEVFMLALDKEVTDAKNQVLRQQMFQNIDAWVASDEEFPVSATSESWNKLNISKLYQIVEQSENSISGMVKTKANEYLNVTVDADGRMSSDGKMKNALNSMVTSLTAEGWSMAGGWFQRLGTVRSRLNSIFEAPTGTASKPTLDGLGKGDTAHQVATMYSSVSVKINKLKEQYLGSSPSSGPSQGAMENLVPSAESMLKEPSLVGILNTLQAKLNNWLNGMMKSFINALVGADPISNPFVSWACGASSEIGGSLNRMKCVGDGLSSVQGILYAAEFRVKATNLTAKVAVAGWEGFPGAQYVSNVEPVGVAIDYFLAGIVLPIIEKVSKWIGILAFYFGVFLPALPYITFFTVVIGWVLSVIQTSLVAPIWMLMHMQPEQSFVGSQRQGYLMLMSLFVRPMLALIGLFAAILVSDPVINYVTDAFFSMREALIGSGGTAATLGQFWQTFWWIGLYAAVLLPILYMIFGLAQTMPDEILRWVGGGIGSLGETTANSGIVGAMDSFGKTGGSAGKTMAAGFKGLEGKYDRMARDRDKAKAAEGAQDNAARRQNTQYQGQQGAAPQLASEAGGRTMGQGGAGNNGGGGGGRGGKGSLSNRQGAEGDVTDVDYREVGKDKPKRDDKTV